jgi:O-antigen/teichoic acid export membrane protein
MTAHTGSRAGPSGGSVRRTSAGRQSARASAVATWRRNTDVLANAGTLVATTGVSSLLGFAYWALAARLSSQQAVGYGSAAVSAMTLLGTIGMLGLGTVLIGELPRRTARAGLVSAALLTSGAGSLVLGLVFAVAAPHVNETFTRMTGTVPEAVLFAAGVALTGATLVFDQAAVGLLRGGLQLRRNSAFAVAKLLILPAAAIVLHDKAGLNIVLSWVTGTAVSVLPVALRLRLSGTSVLPRPDWAVLRRLGRAAVVHNWLNLAIQVPRLLMPVLVTVIISPAANAAFYAAWTLSGFLYIVPTHLATALFAVAAGDAKATARKLRLTLRLSVLIGLPAMAVLGFGAHLALSLFGASYAAAATVPLWMLVIGYLPVVPKLHYIAVCRAADQVPRAALVLSLAAAAEVTAAAAGGLVSGLKGLSVALLAVFFLEGLVTGPRVLRAALGRGRHTRTASTHPLAGSPGRHRHSDQGYAGPRPPTRLRRREELL